jgi:hypothetical protein
MVPSEFPHDLIAKPKLLGEKLVYDGLGAGLGDTWSVFYDRPVRATSRRVDFIAINAARGAIAIEVKGGLVHARRGAFRQLIAASGQRKRINPFGQVKMAFARVCDAAGVDAPAVPVEFVIWFPQMAQSAFTWPPSPHIWTRETIELKDISGTAALARLAAVLKGQGR